jgi:hypothetical protein
VVIGGALLAVWALLWGARAVYRWLIGNPEVFVFGLLVVALIASTQDSGRKQ